MLRAANLKPLFLDNSLNRSLTDQHIERRRAELNEVSITLFRVCASNQKVSCFRFCFPALISLLSMPTIQMDTFVL